MQAGAAGRRHDQDDLLAVMQRLVAADVAPADGDDQVREAAGEVRLRSGQLVEQVADGGAFGQATSAGAACRRFGPRRH